MPKTFLGRTFLVFLKLVNYSALIALSGGGIFQHHSFYGITQNHSSFSSNTQLIFFLKDSHCNSWTLLLNGKAPTNNKKIPTEDEAVLISGCEDRTRVRWALARKWYLPSTNVISVCLPSPLTTPSAISLLTQSGQARDTL